MKHRYVLRMLNDYADGLLDMELKEAVDKHLYSCRSCRERLERVVSVRDKISQLHKVSAPPDFLESVHRRLETEQKPRFSFRKSFGQLRIALPVGVAALATAAIALIFVLNVIEPKREMGEMVARDEPETLIEREKASVEVPKPSAGDDHPDEDRDKKEQIGVSELESTAFQDKAMDEEEFASAPAKRAEPEITLEQKEPPQITFVLFKEKSDRLDREAFGDEVRAGAAKSRRLEKAAAEENGVHQMAEGLSVEDVAAEDVPAPSGVPENVYATVEQAILDAGGSILSIDYGEKGDIPQSMVVEIPTYAVDIFIDDLIQYGGSSLPGELILPEELTNGMYTSQVTDDMKAIAIRISFE